MSQPAEQEQPTYYERVGGHETFVKLVHEFYRGVATDEPLRALYPEEDLGPAEDRLRMFLEQYWGGPKTYSETRGHPRLRMRHVDYAVTPTQRDRWLKHMFAAIDTLDLDPMDDELMRGYMSHAANFMINAEDED
ncbi:MAG: globin [Actinomycetales bacterium]|nr:globin [Actinomycetales bacterium]